MIKRLLTIALAIIALCGFAKTQNVVWVVDGKVINGDVGISIQDLTTDNQTDTLIAQAFVGLDADDIASISILNRDKAATSCCIDTDTVVVIKTKSGRPVRLCDELGLSDNRILDIAQKISWIGTSNYIGDQNVAYQQLLSNLCTNSDLITLAQLHPKPQIRALAFEFLTYRDDPSVPQLLEHALTDTCELIRQSADVRWTSNVAEYDVWAFRNSQMIDSSLTYNYQVLDSLLIFTPNLSHIDFISIRLLPSLPALEKYYARLHSMFEQEGIDNALIPLARYHREQDISLISQALSQPSKAYAALHAVANWPHPSFLPHLLSLFDSNLKSTGRDDLLEAFYSALMAYDDQATYDVIDQILSHLEGRMLERNSKAFKSVLKEQERPRYMPIWEKHRIRIALMTKVPG